LYYLRQFDMAVFAVEFRTLFVITCKNISYHTALFVFMRMSVAVSPKGISDVSSLLFSSFLD
jgi:hypothetical protein